MMELTGRKLTVLMVCMGNICRSPTAEAVLRKKLRLAGLGDQVTVRSAGTHAWHEGAPPDHRSVTHAQRRGYDLADLRARRVVHADFETCDFILAMDDGNLRLLEERCPVESHPKLGRLGTYGRKFGARVIPDPYQGGPQDFDHVLDLVEDACEGFIDFLLQKQTRRTPGTS